MPSLAITPSISVRILAVLSALLLIGAYPAPAQTETVLYNFGVDPDGENPAFGLTADGAGNFYGTTEYGGLGEGTVFELSPNGTGGWHETVLYRFCAGGTGCADGVMPSSSVIFDNAGNLYGTTLSGGATNACDDPGGCGVVFELYRAGKSWKEKVLHSFAGGTDGKNPVSGVIIDRAGHLYGTTNLGGPGGRNCIRVEPGG